MSLRDWIVQHTPMWLTPITPWDDKGRPEMPERHAVINRQQAASLRIDRLFAEARRQQWREEQRRQQNDGD